jgi:hypothetical protein
VEVVTGETCYPVANGFSAIYSEVTTDDANSQRQLSEAQQNQLKITLRCAMLDATGPIGKCREEGLSKTFVLCLEDIRYRKPGQKD